MIGAGGMYPPPEGYLARVAEICRAHDVLLVADEVITGFGRTGHWFASARFGIEPDLMTTAKGLTSGYAPLGAVIVGPRVSAPFWRPGSAEVSGTATRTPGTPPRARSGSPTGPIERDGLLPRVAGLEGVLAGAVRPLAENRLVSEVRAGTGLLAAVQLAPDAIEADPGLGTRLVADIRRRGVITRLLRGRAADLPAVRDHRGGDHPARRDVRGRPGRGAS